MNDKDKDSISIIIKDPPKGPYYCNLGNFKLHLQDKETGEYICPRCSTSYFPNLGEKVKRANKFETPAGRDKMSLLSLVDDNQHRTLNSIQATQITQVL